MNKIKLIFAADVIENTEIITVSSMREYPSNFLASLGADIQSLILDYYQEELSKGYIVLHEEICPLLKGDTIYCKSYDPRLKEVFNELIC